MSLSHSSSDQHSLHADRPERSRNAKAQARHRAKRKAYIEQLEQTVTKLQTVLALSPDQVTTLPPPLARIRELEEENELLHREIDDLRRQLELRNARLRPDLNRRVDILTPAEDDRADREAKRRRMTDSNVYMQYASPPSSSQSSNGSHGHSPPPPLLIPSSSSHHSHTQQSTAYQRTSSSSIAHPYGLAVYPIPGTPSGSSSTSSPSFSPSDYAPSSEAQSHHRATMPTAHHAMLPPFSHTTNQYEYVKLEEESYQQHHAPCHTNGYATTVHPYGNGQAAMNEWHGYSTAR